MYFTAAKLNVYLGLKFSDKVSMEIYGAKVSHSKDKQSLSSQWAGLDAGQLEVIYVTSVMLYS